jgi:hypothetical protein
MKYISKPIPATISFSTMPGLLIIQRQPVKDKAIGTIRNEKKRISAGYLHGSGRVRQHPISRFRETLDPRTGAEAL